MQCIQHMIYDINENPRLVQYWIQLLHVQSTGDNHLDYMK